MSRKNIQDFIVLPLKFSEDSTAHHEIFVKEHKIRNQAEETPKGKTLFVLNVPPYATEQSLQRIFSAAGPVTDVTFQQKRRTGFKTAYVVYKNDSSLPKSLKLTKLKPLSSSTEVVRHGVAKWVHEYNEIVPNVREMQERINNFMLEYDKQMELKKREEQEAGEEDEDGWITVTKHSRRPGLSRKEVVDKRLKQKLEQGKQKKELKNFYTFQIRESKMKHLAALRQKFEEDKKKINSLKQARKFKPF